MFFPMTMTSIKTTGPIHGAATNTQLKWRIRAICYFLKVLQKAQNIAGFETYWTSSTTLCSGCGWKPKRVNKKKNLKSNEIFQFPWNHFPCIVSMSTISSFCCLRCEAVIRRITCSTKFSAIYVFLALTTFSSSLKLCNIPGHLCSAIWRYER